MRLNSIPVAVGDRLMSEEILGTEIETEFN